MRSRAGRVAAAILVAALVLSGCSTGGQLTPTGRGAVGNASDLNPQNPQTLQEGGNLRLALIDFPPNFNILHIDGNSSETAGMLKSTLPSAFTIAADGSATVNTNYFTSVELTGTNPQVITYTIDPKAVWSDGSPITWRDIASQIHATSGTDTAFEIATTNGADRVASVTRGVDDRQAIMTFAKPYAEWRGMFAGNGMLLPESVTATPEAFNKGWLDAPGLSAGPFIVSTLDRAKQRIVLTRNPRWWGTQPRLDSITYLVLDDPARLPALQNNTIDATGVASLDQLIIAERTKGISIRQAPAPVWTHFTMNGANGSILSDRSLRLAVSEGIDRRTIANVALHGLTGDPVPLNNHIFVAGQEGYQDNSIPYDPERAKRELDALGWKLNSESGFREKDGRQLVVRMLFYDAQSTKAVTQIAQHSLAEVGVKLDLQSRSGSGFFRDYVNVGAFDIALFGWVGDAFPLSGLTQIYASNGDSNFGKIGSPEIDDAIERTLGELDPGKARALANDVDRLIWAEGFSLPLIQSPGPVAVRSRLANFGARGLADLDYTAIGFMR
ncbi:ABC transporter family substrate-binding protein [Mycobacterium paragordonae]|uniref:ABC transporter family substrate-binding protein n=1 Tax=Mycobacterium paragordonae TaxID=1389713 RepID=A0A4R5WT02_9MYCO|nr:ABC transporter family substrate-binding protein [Mycobacterium paragordonae]MDP7733399.1 ABC transporter family substrate-binding protein [Mycobacterium paragordonae]TDK96012.1 ABC transporter family substrate-binding protein [Mycobacterium paragordonae]TDL07884.1 ABC transporter family substrate-binding protein [Mycobacterium paragordonae]